MWRLMMTMIVTTNTGGVAVDSQTTDWPTLAQCEHVIATMYNSPPTADVGGLRLAIRMGAQCVHVGPVQGPGPAYVEEVAPAPLVAWPRPAAPLVPPPRYYK
jgi:hypothetical protein